VRFVFFPQIEGNSISATLTMPEGTPFERTDAAIRQITAAAEAVAEKSREKTGEEVFVSITATSGG
jgi:multidrug efflux pump subunit AcrB